MARFSILQDDRRCYITNAETGLDYHHIFQNALRPIADRYGFGVWLDHRIHMCAHERRPPFDHLIMDLRRECQRKFEETHTRDEWMQIIGRNYL